MEFTIDVLGLQQFQEFISRAPAVVVPILSIAVRNSIGILTANTSASTVPIKSGTLIQSFRAGYSNGGLNGSWGPHTSYAAAVEFGMPSSPGRYVPAIGRRLKNPNNPSFGVWPGFKGRQYMEKIIDGSTVGIADEFENALQKITSALAGK